MSGIYTNNIVNRMPIIWDICDVDGNYFTVGRGQVYACEGDARAGFIFLVITETDNVVQVSVRDDHVRLDKEAIQEGERKEANRAASQIIAPPAGGGPSPEPLELNE